MKPVQLELINFGPYRRAVVNFETFSDEPLFLIGGNTGAGKSTLFDGMTMALFDKGTGERKPEEMRSNFATLEDPLTEIIFHFRQGGQLYQIRRTPKQLKLSKNKSKPIEHKPTAHLSIVETVDGIETVSLATLHRDVAIHIRELLGFNGEQFKQIILLPQNEFRKFLHSESGEKLDTLKNIFGIRIFELFAKGLKERLSDAKQDVGTTVTQLNSFYESDVFSEMDKAAILETPVDEKVDVIGSIVTKNKAHVSQMARLKEVAQGELDHQTTILAKALKVASDFDALADAKQQFEQDILEKLEDYDSWTKRLSELTVAQTLKQIIQKRDETAKLIAEQNARLQQKKQLLDEKMAQKTLVEEKRQALTDEQSNISQLEENAKAWTHLIQVAKEKQAAVLAQKAATTAHIDALSNGDRVANKLTEAKQALKQLEVTGIEEGLLKRMQQDIDQMNRVYYEQLSPANYELEQLKSEYQEKTVELEQLTAQRVKKKENFEEIANRLATVKNQRMGLLVAQLRADLVDGNPCQVCGGLEHPFAHVDIVAADTLALRGALEEFERLQGDVGRLTGELAEGDVKLEKTLQLVADLKRGVAEGEVGLAALYGELLEVSSHVALPETFQVESFLATVAALKAGLKKMTDEMDEQVAARKKLGEVIRLLEMDKIEADLLVREKETLKNTMDEGLLVLGDKYPHLESVADYEVKIADARRAVDAFSVASKQLEEEMGELIGVHGALSGEVVQLESQLSLLNDQLVEVEGVLDGLLVDDGLGVLDLVVVREWMKDLPRLSEIGRLVTDFESKRKHLSEVIAGLELDLRTLEKPDVSQVSAHHEELQVRLTTVVAEESVAKKQYDLTKGIYEKILAGVAAQKVQLVHYQALFDLHQVMNADKGSKINLETYVIRVYLEKVLNFANRHYLELLTGGRYQLTLSGSVRDGRRASGLDIDVFDLTTGTVRSTKTLSGGETFVCALAIALSLSEVVRNEANGANIEALFIDEGFGSLDPEMLHLAMTALEKIGVNRMVGVISHVSEMKARVAQQLMIRKMGDGSSEIEQILLA